MRDLWLSFGGTEKELVGYADADESMVEDSVVLAYVFLVDGGAICIFKYEVTGDCFIVNDGEQVHSHNTCSKKSTLASIVDWSGVQTLSLQHCHHIVF